MADFIPCVLKRLPPHLEVTAAREAVRLNPANAPNRVGLTRLGILPTPDRLAFLRGSLWPSTGVHLTVGFLERVPAALQDKILFYANKWGDPVKGGNVSFSITAGPAARADVRVTLAQSGLWSFLGQDIRHVPAGEPTMCFQSWSLNEPDSEFDRVITHEFGHTLAAVHEHLRKQIVDRIDVAKALAYFEANQGWSEAEVRGNVLTPIEEQALLGTPVAYEDSDMAYSLPGSIMKDGKPVVGGSGITASDYAWVAKVYPRAVVPPPQPPPQPPPAGNWSIALPAGATLSGTGAAPVVKAS